MNTPGKIITLDAGADVAKYRIVKIGSADYAGVQAAAVGDALIGVSTEIAADSGDRLEVIISGVATVEYGGNVTRGALLTTDSDGKAVTAAPAAGVNNQVIGRAIISGAAGDYGSVLIVPHQIQGAA